MPHTRSQGGRESQGTPSYDIITGQPKTPYTPQHSHGTDYSHHSTMPLTSNYSDRSHYNSDRSHHHSDRSRYNSDHSHHHSDTYGAGYSHGSRSSHRDGSQLQAQDHMFRNAQASKQMVYDVYGNTLTMLEELEQRELKGQSGKSLARSDIRLPSQSSFDDSTVQRKVDTQLLLLQSQLESCDRQILAGVTDDLQKKTLDWNSHREARGVKRGKADKYVGKLYEVLATGKTKHPKEFYAQPSISEQDMQKSLGAYIQGTQIRDNLDWDFKNNPNKQAMAPRVRDGAGINLGADRMLKERSDLRTSINKHRTTDLK